MVGDRIKLEIASKVSADRRLRQASTDKYFGTPSRTMRASSDLHTKGSTLSALLTDPDPAKAGRVMNAMLQMDKLDLPALQRARDGT